MIGRLWPMMRELSGAAYQFTAPFVIDDSTTRAHFGIQPQPWEQTLAGIVSSARPRQDSNLQPTD